LPFVVCPARLGYIQEMKTVAADSRAAAFSLQPEVGAMHRVDYRQWEDERLVTLLFEGEDRIELAAAEEMARRDSLLPLLAQVVCEKESWLAELPEWWAVVHATYILGHRGGEEVVIPLLTALRWADAFDCDWVTEPLPSILGRLGPPVLPGLTAVVRDLTAGWSARELAMKGLAAVTLHFPDAAEHVFRIIGQIFMDEGEDRLVRKLAGHTLLDFRRQEYRMALVKFAREEALFRQEDEWYPVGFYPEDVEQAFRNPQPDTWEYDEDWMRFYHPGEIQRRQRRWARERLGRGRGGRALRQGSPGGGQVLPLGNYGRDPDDNGRD